MRQRLLDTRLLITAGLADFCVHVALGALSFHATRAFGATPTALGGVGFAMDAIYCLVAFAFPRWTDRLSRRTVMRLAAVAIAAGCVVARVAPSLPVFVCGMMLVRAAGAVFWPTIQARMADQAFSDLARAASAFSLSWSVGKSLGYGVNALVFGRGWLDTIDAYVLAAGVGLLIALAAPADRQRPTREQRTGSKDGQGDPMLLTKVRMAWVGIFLGCAVFTVLLTQNAPLMTARGFTGPEGEGTGNLMLATVVVSNILVFEWLRRTPQLVGRVGMLASVPITLLGGVAVLFNSASVPWLLVAAALYGIGGGIAYTQSLALSLRLPRDASSAAGLHEAVLGLANALVAPLAGYAAGSFGSANGSLFVPAACCVAGFLTIAFLARHASRSLPASLEGPMSHE